MSLEFDERDQPKASLGTFETTMKKCAAWRWSVSMCFLRRAQSAI